jgi:hypothetical protein
MACAGVAAPTPARASPPGAGRGLMQLYEGSFVVVNDETGDGKTVCVSIRLPDSRETEPAACSPPLTGIAGRD